MHSQAIFFGEVLIDIVRRNGKLTWHFGGAPANAAVAASRQGARVALVATVGRDHFGEALRSGLANAGVNCDAVRCDPLLPTSLALAMTDARTIERFVFYRQADVSITQSQGSVHDFGPGSWLVFGSLSLCHPSTRAVLAKMVKRARKARSTVFLDANYRDSLWGGDYDFRSAITRMARHSDVLKVNLDEAEVLCATRDPMEAATRLSRLGFSVVILTLGASGCLIRTPVGVDFQRPPIAVSEGDTIGTGDAFVGAFVASAMTLSRRSVHTLQMSDFVELNRMALTSAVDSARRMGAGWDS